MKNVLLILLFNVFIGMASTQKESPIKFSYQYIKKNDSDNVKLIVENVLSTKTFYYSIGVEGLTDTGWVGLNADINSLGVNEFWALKAIKPRSKVIKTVSKKRIFHLYKYYKITKIKFGVTYFEKKDFSSKSETIYLPPMEE